MLRPGIVEMRGSMTLQITAMHENGDPPPSSLLTLPRPPKRTPAKLQDAVPPFPTPLAMELLEEELAQPPSEVFSEISEDPIASASLAQVCACSAY